MSDAAANVVWGLTTGGWLHVPMNYEQRYLLHNYMPAPPRPRQANHICRVGFYCCCLPHTIRMIILDQAKLGRQTHWCLRTTVDLSIFLSFVFSA